VFLKNAVKVLGIHTTLITKGSVYPVLTQKIIVQQLKFAMQEKKHPFKPPPC